MQLFFTKMIQYKQHTLKINFIALVYHNQNLNKIEKPKNQNQKERKK